MGAYYRGHYDKLANHVPPYPACSPGGLEASGF